MVRYKKVKIGDLFEIQKVTGINKDKLRLSSNGEFDYITRTSLNNGIESKTEEVPGIAINEANTYSLGLLQMTFFYREKPWYAGQFVRKILPKQYLTREQSLYFLTLFRKLSTILLGYLVRDVDEVFTNYLITLPVNEDDSINFEYMGNYIKQLEANRLQQLEAYLITTGLNNYVLTDKDTLSLSQINIADEVRHSNNVQESEQIRFKEFKFEDLFNSETGDVDLQNKDINGKGQIFINSGKTNFGIKGRTTRKAKIFPANTITVDFLGNAYYRDYEYKLATHNHVFSLSGEIIKNKKVGLFLVSTMLYLTRIFAHSNMLTWNKLKEQTILLPIKNNGELDFEYMENYIRAIEKLTIKDVVEYKDKMIALTKEII